MHFQPLIYKLCVFSAVGAAALFSACGGGGADSGAANSDSATNHGISSSAKSDTASADTAGAGTAANTPNADAGGTAGTKSDGPGTLQVLLTDAPACGFDHVYVTVRKVRINRSADAGADAGGWHEIVLGQPKKIDLLTLTNGVLENLGEVSLPAGNYAQMRLVLAANGRDAPTANSVIVSGTATEMPLATPSGIQSGIKLHHPFDIEAGARVSLALDFDACKSIVTKGNGSYSLKPVINVIPMMTSGSISGYVPVGLSNTIVSAQENGVVVRATVPDAQGRFSLSPLPQKSTGYAVVVTAGGGATAAITGVPVTAGADTQVSTERARVALMGSAMRTISGSVDPVSAQGMVRATQSYANGPTIEVTYRSADQVNGTYTMSVATAAPLIGAFGALPIALRADSSAAGRYTLETSAAGFATLTANADVSAANAVHNFMLQPRP